MKNRPVPVNRNGAAPMRGFFVAVMHARIRATPMAFVVKKQIHRLLFSHEPAETVSAKRNREMLSLFRLNGVLVGLDHLLRRDTRTTSTPCIELFKPFFGAFARKNFDFKLRCIIIS